MPVALIAGGAALGLGATAATALAVGGVAGAYANSKDQAKATKTAAGIQADAAARGAATEEQRFQNIVEMLSPYREVGQQAVGAQGDLIGLNGSSAQQKAIDALKAGPQFQAMLQQGENSILSNASATGGLRGGNTQAALAQFSPALLSQLINNQYANLGGLTSVGENAAAMTGNAGLQTGTNIANAQNQIGAAQAGGALANTAAQIGFFNNAAGIAGQYFGGGFGGAGGSASSGNYFGGLKF